MSAGGRGRFRQGDDGLAWTGERQVGRTLDAIRPDHVARYEWAAKRLPVASAVLDAGCGAGYGAAILRTGSEHQVDGCDIDARTVEYARAHWTCNGRVRFFVRDLLDPEQWDERRYGAIVALEVLEHVDRLDLLLARFHAAMEPRGVLLASTPNEARRPYDRAKFPFHFRHYTHDELAGALRAARFIPALFWLQDDAEPRPYRADDPAGKFLLVLAVRA